MRTCKGCGESKPLDQFYRRKSGSHNWTCKPCWHKRARAYNAANADKLRVHRRTYKAKNKERCAELTRKSQLKTKYGMTPAEYEAMRTEQGGRCAICHQERELVVDHCHAAKRVRKLLCDDCNRGIGCFRDDPERLRQAADYLDEHEVAAEVIAAYMEICE